MLDLEPIKKRLAERTPGEWVASHDCSGFHDTRQPCVTCEFGNFNAVANTPRKYSHPEVFTRGPIDPYRDGGNDVDLIANAPTDLEALVAEVELLRSIITALAEDDPKGEKWLAGNRKWP